MPSNHGFPYTLWEKQLIYKVATTKVKSRNDMKYNVAPRLANLLGRTECAICKQIELALGKHWTEQF